jgi:hypothetical protein
VAEWGRLRGDPLGQDFAVERALDAGGWIVVGSLARATLQTLTQVERDAEAAGCVLRVRRRRDDLVALIVDGRNGGAR